MGEIDENSQKVRGFSTKYLHFWDEKYGWIHVSEKKKLKEAYNRFKENERLLYKK